MPLRRQAAAQPGVDRGRQRPPPVQGGVVGILGRRVEVQPRIVEPAVGIVGQVQRRTDKRCCTGRIARSLGLTRPVLMFLGRVGIGDVQPAQCKRQTAGLFQIRRRDEGREVRRTRRRKIARPGVCGNHARRIGTLIEGGLSRPRFQETGTDLAVEGQGVAAGVGQAGGLASLDGDIQEVADITRRQIGILGVDQPLGRNQFVGPHCPGNHQQGRAQRRRQTKSTHRKPPEGTHLQWRQTAMRDGPLARILQGVTEV